MLELGYHQYHPQYFCLKLTPSSSSCSYSCSCSCSCPVFQSIFQYLPIPNGYALRLIYIDPHLVQYTICLNINFDYCSHCLLNLWSLPTSVTSECTALLGRRSVFGGVSDSGFSSCAAPTY